MTALNSQPLNSQPLNSQPLNSQPLNSQPLDSQPLDSHGRSAAKQALLERRLSRLTAAAKPAATVRATIPRRPDGEQPPLSYAQERLWFMEQFAPGTAAYGTPLVLRFGADLDLDALGGALRDLVTRHESLRMRFPATEDGRPTVVVDPPADVPVRIVDLAGEGTAGGTVDERAADEAAMACALQPFDLARGPLLRVTVLRGSGAHTVLLDLHHIVTDGWSNDQLLADLARLYRARRDGEPAALPPLPIGYGDFASWQREQAAGPGVQYWLRRLRGVPALELATDAPRPPTQTFAGESHRFTLDPALVRALTDLGRGHRATLFMTMLAGYQALLGRYTRQSDFAVGSPVAGRSAPELDGVVGMFVNMLPLRADLDGDPTGDQLVARTRDCVLDALANQDVPLEKVVNELGLVRDVSRSPLFQTMFVLQNYDRPDQQEVVGAGTDIGWQPVELPATRYDLELHAYATPDGGLRCRFVYNTALFAQDTVARLAGHLTTLLRDLAQRPGVALSRLRLMDDAERALVLDKPSTEYEVTDTLPSLFERQVARTPGATAVSCGREHVSYAELNRRANRLAHHLRGLGVRPDDRVALCLERGIDTVVATLAVLKAGGGYVPLDPAYPAQRLRFILDDTAARVLVTQRSLRDDIDHRGPVVLVDDEYPGAETDPEPLGGPERLAYVIYTSGSTGQPKGVLVEHRQVVRLLSATGELFDFGGDDVWAMLHSYAFDFSVWELWGALARGGRVVVVGTETVRDHDRLLDVLRTERVTVLNQTPPAFRGLRATLEATGRSFADLAVRTIVFGGDALHVRELDRWFAEHGDQRPALVNMYGITETTVHVTFRRITAADLTGGASSPIGRPLPDLRGYVLDEHRGAVPIGVPGELYVAGAGLARGYLNRPELTEQRFVHEFGERLYRTGDLVRRLPNGELDYLGRVDQQVKVRGYRIELGEISATLERHPAVRTAVVVADEDGHGDRRLVAYLVASGADPGGAQPSAGELREHLGRTLPKYMVPAAFVVLDALPLTPNGKLDRKALPAPTSQADGEFVAPQTELQRHIAQVWCEVLGVERVGIDDDFFALGGHSLLATQVVAKLRRHTEGRRQVGVVDLFQQPTVRGLAALVEDAAAAGGRSLLYELTASATKRATRAETVCSYVCVPYGGGSAIVYQPIADAMPAGHTLYSVAIPGHDVGLDEDALPFDELARRCTAEILDRVEGPLVLYGHCGVGGALIVELARQLEAAGRELEAVYIGGIFPFANPKGRLARMHQWLEDRASNRTHANWLKAMGVDMDDLDPAQADRIISNMRRDGHEAEAHFTSLMDSNVPRLRAPVITVVGERDPVTDFYQERYREWQFIADTAAVVVLDEAGHFFLRYRAEELATIITGTHRLIADGRESRLARGPDQQRWWLHEVSRSRTATSPGTGTAPTHTAPTHTAPTHTAPTHTAPTHTVPPSLRRFAAVSAGQLVSTIGSAITAWAIPIWVLQQTGSVMLFSLTGVLAFIPLLVALPLAGAVADRFDRRRVMMAAGAVAAGTELTFAALLWTGSVPLQWVFPIVLVIGFAATFQRMAFISSIPQLVPKRYLGRANGVAQLINGIVMLSVPLLAAGMLALIGLRGILAVDLLSYAFALSVLAAVKFPALMGRVRKETFGRQLLGGLRMSWGQPHFRAMLLYFAVGNLLFAPALLLVTPLVLSFETLAGVGRVALAEGAGAMIGAFVIMLWGGPRRRRMRAIMYLIAAGGLFVALTGLHQSLELIMLAVFSYTLVLAMADGIYLTIIEVKIPQRFHARVIALNQAIAWSTIPVGFVIIGAIAEPVFEPLLAPGGPLAGSVGTVIGTGDGRGIAFIYLVFGLAMIVNALGWLAVRRLRRLDEELPDALPDDLVGVRTLAEREARP